MKKTLALLLAVILIMVWVPAMANDYTDMLAKAVFDAAFDHDNLMLIKTDFPATAASDFEFPDEMWEATGTEKPADPVAEVDAYLRKATVTWLSLSPAGNSGILDVDRTSGICYYAGKYHFLYPSHTRGVEDINGNLAWLSSRGPWSRLGEEGVIYSPDGRYAAIFDIRIFEEGNYALDPVIIDLSTGEMFLSATYENRPRSEEVGTVTTATFSSDGRYLYYMLFGAITEYHRALYRYNLQEDTTELCYSGSKFNYYPFLSETGKGAFVNLRHTPIKSEMAGITSISYQNGVWTGNELSFDLPMQYWNCNRLLLSANSGYAFIPGRNIFSAESYYAFQCVRPDDDFAGLNQYYAISKDNQLQAYTANEISALFDNWMNTHKGVTSDFNLDMPFQSIITAVLSPDGHYALLNTSNPGTWKAPKASRHLYLVRLDDLAIREVRGIDPNDIPIPALSNYKPRIEWHTDTLIINTNDGIQAYMFKLQ